MNEAKTRKSSRIVRRTLIALAVTVSVCIVFWLSLPFIVTHIPIPEISYDLTPHLGEKARTLVDGTNVTAYVEVMRGRPDGFRITASGRLLDWSYRAAANVRFSFIGAKGDASFSIVGTDWKANAEFDVKSKKEWSFRASLPEMRLSQNDAILSQIIERACPKSISNLVFSANLSLDAEGESTPERPFPKWSAKCTLKDADASMDIKGRMLGISNFRVRAGARGFSDIVQVDPLFPRVDSLECAGFVLTNAFASIRATERSYLVTEAGAGCCGGELRLYSLFLDPERLTAGATIFADGVDAGEVLKHISAFKGEASGRMHGKLPFFLKDGKTLTLQNAYLFSTPGETGKMRISDARPVMDNLERAGVDAATRNNLATALGNLDYKVMKIELKRGEEKEDSTLSLKIEGTSTKGKTTVPVNLNLNFNGDLDTIVNTGIKISRR